MSTAMDARDACARIAQYVDEDPITLDPLRWYSIAQILAMEPRTTAFLLTRAVRENGGAYGCNLERAIRARGERVELLRRR